MSAGLRACRFGVGGEFHDRVALWIGRQAVVVVDVAIGSSREYCSRAKVVKLIDIGWHV